MTSTITERTEYDQDGVTYTLEIDGREYSRRVEIHVDTDNDYGADADGRRGTQARFLQVDTVDDLAPAEGTPDRQEWDEAVLSAEYLLNEWAENYTGDN